MRWLLNMPPRFMVHNRRNMRWGNAIFFGNILASQTALCNTPTNGTNGIFGQFRIPPIRATRHASLPRRIRLILGVSTDPQMRRVHTQPVIASRAIVANVHAFGNRSMREFIRKAVRQIPYFVLSATDIEPAITRSTMNVSSPNPTGIWIIGASDTAPECLINRFAIGILAISRTKHMYAVKGRRVALHIAPTLHTCTLDGHSLILHHRVGGAVPLGVAASQRLYRDAIIRLSLQQMGPHYAR